MTLADTLCLLGPEMTQDPEIIKSSLARYGHTDTTPPTDSQVVEMMAHLSQQAAEGRVSFDMGCLVRVLSNMVRTAFAF
jgi:CCR4-NOT transcription complex subunit 1